MPPKKARLGPAKHAQIPLLYRLFLLYIEPISAIVGAVAACFASHTYLKLTHDASTPPTWMLDEQISTKAVLDQLANLYLLFAINEALVLRSTHDLRVWRALLTGLLIADFGHLWSVRSTGSPFAVYLAFWRWNPMGWGNVGFVYAGITCRLMFLTGVGLRY